MADFGNNEILGLSLIILSCCCIHLLIVFPEHSPELSPSPLPPPPPPPPPRGLIPPNRNNPTVSKIVDALLSRGNYSALVPDLVSKFAAAEVLCRIDGEITVFVPRDDSTYRFCESERPGVRIVTSRVDRESFGERGRPLSNGSVRRTCGREAEIRIEAWRNVRAEVKDWNLYDDGRVLVHGFGGELTHNLVTAVERLTILGLVEQRRDPPGILCRSVPPELVNSFSYLRRVDGRWWD
ncbi:unnamed protein product [Linum tenue]|uniref:Uncharacterized protein n=1 Tax=Linum tenue TaxID=586396 RepID=A0AAV0IBR1_9ROSI|nr:unnamed protein product [Linum tenue]